MARDLRIDTLRGLACILLVAFHVVGSERTGLRLRADHLLSDINQVMVYFRMPLFCFLSGFVYAWRPYKGDALLFIKGKVRRLLVPMLLAGTFFAVLQAFTPGTNDETTDWHLLHIEPVAHFWFLESLFIVFLVTACLERFQILSTPLRWFGVWALAVALFMFTDLPAYFGLYGAVYLFPFFLLGLGCKRFSHLFERIPRYWLALAVIAYVLYMFYDETALPGWNSLTAVLLGAASCVALLRSQMQIRWLAWIGYFSFSIYLFHSMFSAASRIVLVKLGIDSVAVLFVSGLLAGIFGSIVTNMVLRRVPLGHWVLGEQKKPDTAGAKLVKPSPTTTLG
jgi:fucose 4-O-acetylase-like acetyltransferase